MMNCGAILLDDRNDELKIKEVCDSIFIAGKLYKFVAMDITKQKFYYYERKNFKTQLKAFSL